MQIHELKLSKKRKRGQRVGRGGKRGIYSGRGNKGQKARTSHRLRLKRIGSGLSRHIPKLGGFVSRRVRAVEVKIKQLEDKFSDGELITPNILLNKGLIKSAYIPVKIVGNVEINKKFTIKDCLVTAGSKKSVEKAGGKIIAGVKEAIAGTEKK